ncbi:hypothetical protein LCGC14_0786550 [marine sediment metagenome]|uniref:Uncharacterized protein n=1 Tax=marine sediment metagenome TaxID=412755 RepID=A0A0F9SDT3_9ZZZZ|nr:MAG: hypothetical protein Lokiarch_52850 [Candidatus Lokiarchaeum sp. GC14_75]
MNNLDEFIEVPGYGLKRKDLRPWWNNVTQEPDKEILTIDKLEDNLVFPSPHDKKFAYDIRKAIGRLEGCHFKVEHYINRIIYAIRNDHFPQSNQYESAQLNKDWVRKWKPILEYLEKWSELIPEESFSNLEFINGVKTEKINDILGEKTSLKVWQVNFITENIRELLELWFTKQDSFNKTHGQQKRINEKIQHKYEKLNSEFWEKTRELAIPIDEINHFISLQELLDTWEYIVCISNPNFMNDLLAILGTVGGKAIYVHQTCGFYLDSLKVLIRSLSTKLQKYIENINDKTFGYDELMELLGEKTPIKYWLVASLEKTVRFWI